MRKTKSQRLCSIKLALRDKSPLNQILLLQYYHHDSRKVFNLIKAGKPLFLELSVSVKMQLKHYRYHSLIDLNLTSRPGNRFEEWL